MCGERASCLWIRSSMFLEVESEASFIKKTTLLIDAWTQRSLAFNNNKDKNHVLGGYLLPGSSAHYGLPLYLWIRLHRVRRPGVAKEAVALVPSDYIWYVCLRSSSFRLLFPRPMASPAEWPVLFRREGHTAGKLRSYCLLACEPSSQITEARVPQHPLSQRYLA